MSDSIETKDLLVTVQANGWIRNEAGWIIGRLDADTEFRGPNVQGQPSRPAATDVSALVWKKACKKWKADFEAASRGITKLLIENADLRSALTTQKAAGEQGRVWHLEQENAALFRQVNRLDEDLKRWQDSAVFLEQRCAKLAAELQDAKEATPSASDAGMRESVDLGAIRKVIKALKADAQAVQHEDLKASCNRYAWMLTQAITWIQSPALTAAKAAPQADSALTVDQELLLECVDALKAIAFDPSDVAKVHQVAEAAWHHTKGRAAALRANLPADGGK